MAFYDTADAIYGTGLYGTARYGRVTPVVQVTGVGATANTRTIHLNVFEVDISEPIYNAQGATGSVGSLTLHTTAGLAGVSATGTANSVGVGVDVTLSSVSAPILIEALEAGDAVTGTANQTPTSVVGTLTLDTTNLSVRSVNTVSVSGVSATATLGSVEAQTTEALQSVEATGSIGTPALNLNKVVDSVEGEFNTHIRQAFTANGDAQLSTAQKKFGTASLLLDGTGDFIKTDHKTDLIDSNFTVEFWIYTSNRLQNAHLWDGQVANSGIALAITNLGKIRIIQDNLILGTYNNGLSDNTWHHIALVGNVNFLTVFVDGFSRGQANVIGGYGSYPNHSYHIGCRHNETQFFNGYIDEFRTSLTSRYSSTFTPSTTAFSSDSDTESLLHFDGTTGDTDIVNSAPATIGAPFATAKNDSKIVVQGVSGEGQVGEVGGGPAEEIATGVEATGSVGSVTTHVVEKLEKATGTGQIGDPTITAEVFDFQAVSTLYSRRRTVIIPRAA